MKRLMMAALAAAFFVAPAQAQDQCFTVEQAVAVAEESGGAFINLVTVPKGIGFDQLLIVTLRGALVVGLFNDGCAVSSPMALAPVSTVEA